jgi:putative selenium metabolism protein SsnA
MTPAKKSPHPSPELLVGPASVFTPDRFIPGGGVLCRDGRIVAVGPFAALARRVPRAARLDAGDGVILPGFVNIHTHLYSALARGMSLPGKPAADFVQILERLWWRLDKALEPDDVTACAEVGLLECIRSGCTTIIDHHASPNACTGSLDRIRDAVEAAGLRAALCYEVSDRDGRDAARAGIAENVRFARSLRARPSSRVVPMFGIHALFTVSDRTLDACVEGATAEGLGLHLHVAEDLADVRRNTARHGLRVVERLRRHGALGPRTLAAHCVHVDSREIGLLARTGTAVAHNPESNMGNAVGFAPVLAMLRRGVPVGLGTDGYTADMLQESKAAGLLHRHATGDPRRGFADVFRLLFDGNRAIAAAVFGEHVGRLDPGLPADLVVFDYDPPTPLRADNLPGHLLFGLSCRHVRHTVAAGRVLMRDRRVLCMDEKAALGRARRSAERLWRRIR